MWLIEKVKNNEFWPEVYTYPTTRAYEPLNNFSLKKVKFSQDINLYAHIPFCKQICAYCGYLKIIDNSPIMKETYVTCILKEIEMYKDIIKTKTIKTLHIWWGTPSLLSPEIIKKIITKVHTINPNLFKTALEISLEASPETVEYKRFLAYKKAGINRVSIGIQSLDDNEITLCGRKNTVQVSTKAIKTLQKIGFKNVVVDLMIGIQWQTVTSFTKSVQKLAKLQADTIELYALGMMPNTRIVYQKETLMNNKDVYACYDIGRKILLKAWYIQDCHNRYALPKTWWFLQEDYNFEDMSTIGFGAWSRTYGINMYYRNNYYNNVHYKAITEYIADIQANILPAKTGVIISKEEKMRQYAIYNIEHLDTTIFKKKFGSEFKKKFAKIYQELKKLNFITEEKNKITLNAQGLNYRDLIAKQFFSPKIMKWERAYRYSINIIIFGFSWSGKSVITNAVGKKYNLKIVHPSGVLRNLCENKPIDINKTEYNTGFWESKKWVKLFNKRLKDEEPLDIQATKIVINELHKGNVVVDSRDLPRLTNNGIKIYLKADMKVRAQRVAKRSNISYAQSMKILKMKYDKTRELFQKLYNIDITKNREVFDYILETDNLTEKEVSKKVCDFLEKTYPEFKN